MKTTFRHAMLAELQAVDIVDDPAANPNGLFSRDPVYKEAERLCSYVLGDTSEKPKLTMFDVEPDRIASFFTRFLDSKGLTIMSKDNNSEAAETELEAADKPDSELATKPETKEAKPETTGELNSDPRAECKKFVEKFGAEKGGEYYADGLSFEDAQSKFAEHQADEIERLNAKVESLAASSKDGVSGSSEADETKKSGFSLSKLSQRYQNNPFKTPSEN